MKDMKGALTVLVGWSKDPKSLHHGEHWLNSHGCTIEDNYDWIAEQYAEMLLNDGDWRECYPDHTGWEFYSMGFTHTPMVDIDSLDEHLSYNYMRYFNYNDLPREHMQGMLESMLDNEGITLDSAGMKTKPLGLFLAHYEAAPLEYPPVVHGQEYRNEIFEPEGLLVY